MSSLSYQANYKKSEELDYDEEVEVKVRQKEKESRELTKAFIFDRYLVRNNEEQSFVITSSTHIVLLEASFILDRIFLIIIST